jgi:hypothetical protein
MLTVSSGNASCERALRVAGNEREMLLICRSDVKAGIDGYLFQSYSFLVSFTSPRSAD